MPPVCSSRLPGICRSASTNRDSTLDSAAACATFAKSSVPSPFDRASANASASFRKREWNSGSATAQARWRNWSIVSELVSTSIPVSLRNGLWLIRRKGVWYWANAARMRAIRMAGSDVPESDGPRHGRIVLRRYRLRLSSIHDRGACWNLARCPRATQRFDVVLSVRPPTLR